MKFLLVLSVLVILLDGCASKAPKSPVPLAPVVGLRDKVEKSALTRENKAVWDLLSHKKLTLKFKNVDNEKLFSVVILKGITMKNIPSGHWELVGIELDGKSYAGEMTSQRFVLNATSKASVYAGSVLLGCPDLQSKDHQHLKRMNFFDRYPFNSSAGRCELIVGDDYSSVKLSLKKNGRSQKLDMGF